MLPKRDNLLITLAWCQVMEIIPKCQVYQYNINCRYILCKIYLNCNVFKLIKTLRIHQHKAFVMVQHSLCAFRKTVCIKHSISYFTECVHTLTITKGSWACGFIFNVIKLLGLIGIRIWVIVRVSLWTVRTWYMCVNLWYRFRSNWRNDAT